MDLDLLAESESDSESEHSRDQDNVSVQRSVITTAATAGSEAGLAYFSEDDSGDSSNQDEEESDAEGSEEHDDADDIGKYFNQTWKTARLKLINLCVCESSLTVWLISQNIRPQVYWMNS